jgi:hypothetical protein
LIDPHGDLAKLVLSHLVANGTYNNPQAYKKILYLDLPAAERQQRFLAWNVLNQPYDDHTTARSILEALRRAWPSLGDGNAPNFENLVLAGTFVLIQHGLPLPMLHDLLTNKPWRQRLLSTVTDDQVVSFFRDRFDHWAKDQPMLIESSLRRIFLLSFSPSLRYSLSQKENLLNFRRLIDGNKSLIINLALGDADARRLLGCLITVSAETAALSRSDLGSTQRLNSHHLILDEFSEFTAQSEESLSRILSLCRKYGLYLVMAHQTWSQASERLRGALQNVGVEAAFRLGRADAEHSATIMGRVNPLRVKHEVADERAVEKTHPVFSSLPEQWESWAQSLQDLKPREAFIKKSSGKVAKIRSMSVPDPKVDQVRLKTIEDYYLKKYFTPKREIEEQLEKIRTPTTSPTTRVRILEPQT